MENKVFKQIRIRPVHGERARMVAAYESDLYVDGLDTRTVDKMLSDIAVAGGANVLEARQGFAAAVVEPIQQIIPYVEMYARFFQNVHYDYGEDNKLPVEDGLVAVAYASHPQTGIEYVRPGYKFTRPTFSTWTTGVKVNWNMMAHAGWNVLARQMNIAAWEMAKKRDAAAKAVIDSAMLSSHQLSVSGSLTKAAVDEVIRRSNQIGFPVKFAVINPGRLMEMQGWTWGGTGFFIPQGVAQELVDNLYYGNYGGVKWYAHPYASNTRVYFGGDPAQIGWHQEMGSPRNDSAIDIDLGIDKYALRDSYHAWYVGSALSLWHIDIT